MDKKQMWDNPHVESRDGATDDESTLQRQIAALQRQIAVLQRQIAVLREDNEDLRASALWWQALYEEAQRRCADLESSPKARASSRVDQRFRMPSSTPDAPRSGAETRPL